MTKQDFQEVDEYLFLIDCHPDLILIEDEILEKDLVLIG